MVKKIITALMICALAVSLSLALTGCGGQQLAAPTSPDIQQVREVLDGEEVTFDAFTWNKVDGADGYLIYFNDDLSNRFLVRENYLAINEEDISNYLKSGAANAVNIRAVKLDKNNYPVNASEICRIKFNYSKKLQGAPTNLGVEEDGTLTWGSVREAKGYKALVKTTADEDGKFYDMTYIAGATGMTGSIEGLTPGEYLVSVVGFAEGYADSDASKEIEYVNYSAGQLVEWEVTFDPHYDGAETTVENVYNGRKVAEPAEPTREGYDFDGWYEDTYHMVAVQFDRLTITAPITFYAKWTAINDNPGGDTPGGDTPGGGDNPGGGDTPGGGEDPIEEEEPHTYHFDADGDGLCDTCGEEVPEYEQGEIVHGWDGTITVDITGVDMFANADELYIYVWYYSPYSSTNIENAAWPGQMMTKVSDKVYTYRTDAAMSINGIVIHDNNGNQSDDIAGKDVPEDHVLTKAQIGGPEQTTFTVDATGVSELANAENVYIYIWWENGENAAWPGQQMTKGDGNTYSAACYVGKTISGIIVSNGSWQSRDITEIPEDFVLTKDHIYGTSGQAAEWNGTLTVDATALDWFGAAGAKICVHVWYTDNTHNEWDEMTGQNGIYTIQLDATKTIAGIVIARINPDKQAGEEGFIWNQTDDLTDFSGGYTIVITGDNNGRLTVA